MGTIQNVKYLMPKVLAYLLGGLLIGLGMFVFLHYSYYQEYPLSYSDILPASLSTIFAALTLWLSWKLNTKLDNILEWEKVFLLRFASSTIMAMLLSVISLVLVFGLSAQSLSFEEFQPELTKFLIIAFPGALIFIAVYFGYFSYRHYSIVQVAKISDERTQLRLRFEALRNQLSPHYLFNSLNTISSLVYKDAKLAEEFVRRLAASFRYVIGTDQKRLVRLEEEIAFIRSYHHLLKVRFETAVNLNIDIPDDLGDHLIPPLTLQILIENAVKHNQFDNKNRLDIYVVANSENVIVKNNKKESGNTPTSMKVGLENIKSRYTFFSDRKIQIEDLPHEFIVTVPLLAPTDQDD